MRPNASPSHRLYGRARIVRWTARVVAAAIFAMTLPSKLGGAPEAVALFDSLGGEPFGRPGLGAFDAFAVVLLLAPRLAAIGGASCR
jgi:putative oxidoreductase